MADAIGWLKVMLGLDSAAFATGADSAEKRAKKLTKSIEAQGKAMTDLGQKMSIAVTAPLVALGVKSVQAAIESRDALGQVEASLASMGNAAGRTAEQLEAAAGGLMRESLYDDDEILRKVTANLLTFGNVAGEQFDRAQKAAVDLATKMGMDLQSATILVGKALNDPVKGMGALRKAGIQLTDQQKAQVEAMVAVGDTAGAQRILLAELEKQYSGSGEAAQKANPFNELNDALGKFMENVGGKLLEILPNITAAITRVLDAFSSLSPGMQQAVVMGGMFAAALGPVLAVVGSVVSAMAPFIAALGVAFAEGGIVLAAKAAIVGLGAAFGPILLPIAALAAAGLVIYQNWEKIAPVLQELWTALQAALGPPLQSMIETISSTLGEFWNGPLGEMVRMAGQLLGELLVILLKVFGPLVIGTIKNFADLVANVFGMIGDVIKIVSRLLQGDWSGAWDAAVSLAKHALGAINALFGGLPSYVLGVMSQLVGGIKLWLQEKLAAVLNWVGDKIDWVKQKFYDLYDAVVGHSYIPDMVDGIAAQMLRLDSVMVDKADKATKKTKEAFKKLADEVQPLLDRLFPEATALNQFHSDKATIDKAVAAGMLDPAQADEARRRLNREGRPEGSAITALMAAPLVQDMDKIQERLVKLGKASNDNSRGIEGANVRIAKSFKDMADDTLAAVDRMIGAIKGGSFLDILGAVIGLGTQLASVGLFGKGAQASVNKTVPAYASGTSFHPGGLALVGEHGPEIANLPRGTAVYPHGTGPGGGGNVYNLQGNLMTPEFWQMIHAGDARAAMAGSQMAQSRIARRAGRRLS